MTTRGRKRHSPEQIIAKLRDADALLNSGKDLAVALQVFRYGQGIGAVALHPHMQRLQPLQQLPCRHWRERRPERPHDLHARAHGVAEVAERLVEAHAVIAARGLGHAGELAVVPREPAGLDDHPAHGGAVAADVLGSRVHHDVR